jgi:hypothetical protein
MGKQTCGAAKLSRPQREALLALLAYTERCGRSALNTTVAGRVAAPLQVLRPGGGRTNAQSASFSRALRRLEARGLISRGNLSPFGDPPA